MKCKISFRPDPEDDGADGICVNMDSKAALLEDVEAHWKRGAGFTVATVNLDHMVKLQQSEEFLRAYRAHSHIVADGNPIVWLSRLAGQPVRLAPGSELVEPLSAMAAGMHIPVALFGSQQDALDKAAENLCAAYPGLQIVARISPPFGFNPEGEDAAGYIADLKAAGVRLCFVALGAPKQELFAIRAAQDMPDCGFVSVGAGVDFIAGLQNRAPALVRLVAMEWMWRMLSNPLRMGRRYWQCLVILPPLGLATWREKRQRLAGQKR